MWIATKKGWSFRDVEESIEQAAAQFPGVRFIRGMDLIPHDTSLFGDGVLHPNDEGFACFQEGLRAEIC
jgi:hypothetical protein